MAEKLKAEKGAAMAALTECCMQLGETGREGAIQLVLQRLRSLDAAWERFDKSYDRLGGRFIQITADKTSYENQYFIVNPRFSHQHLFLG